MGFEDLSSPGRYLKELSHWVLKRTISPRRVSVRWFFSVPTTYLFNEINKTAIFGYIHLRNEFNFWNVHGIMNTSGLLQS